jgi:hypothetical protein
MIGYTGKPPATGADQPPRTRPYKCPRCQAGNHCEGATVNCDCPCAAMPGADQPPAWHDYDATAIEFEGASDVGLPDGETAAVAPEWWRP